MLMYAKVVLTFLKTMVLGNYFTYFRHCLYCQVPYEKIRHINWETGYELTSNDVIMNSGIE